MEISLPVNQEYIGKTVFQFLKSHGLSKRQLRKLKLQNAVFFNNRPVPLNSHLTTPGEVVIKLPHTLPPAVQSQNAPVKVLYEDDYLIVIDKPAGVLAHPVKNHFAPSMQELTLSYYRDKGRIFEGFYPIYRLDRNTSGPMLIAKFSLIAEMLNNSLRKRQINKIYLALIEGPLADKSGIINLPLGLLEGSIIKRAVVPGGQPACTKYQTVKAFPTHTLLKVELLTGRTHQIRAHFAAIGHPLAGDDLYGGKMDLIERQALHLYYISFPHPITKKTISLYAPLPRDFKEALITLKKASGELL
ncbi:RluA family pseudouridine synthase [Carboxydothermus hydrogenoformans]|uniref:Pseudouridine synthase n=1 Tax=Carboxydothermus hydrogenoformans (strain ATCC BAA-161 / DSM 6008 / Z-2901) TaxID=246194 RepID=Q3AD19_CARHZ|nr:RluA family pseudouridine synthase [Carboxydothermus hydrogenoformans]ABB15556.1 ribosomal large subunit pseudouridine synthase, RluA family [Carboxydothermus hydrogenoformans Z-2901]